jgi:flagellar biosynthetic protein FliP
MLAGANSASATQSFSDLTARSGQAQAPVSSVGADAAPVGETIAAQLAENARNGLSEGPSEESIGGEGRLSAAVEIALLLTVLSLLPAVLVALTSFTRIVIVLSFVRRALSLNELPPNPVIIGLALFLTMFVMAPVGKDLYAEAWTPYEAGDISVEEMGDRAWDTLSTFLVANTREKELLLFAELSGNANLFPDSFGQEPTSAVYAGGPDADSPMGDTEFPGIAPDVDPSDLPLTVVVPAFILSELKTAFQMGFLLFLPFLVIDLVVSSVLLSMGMFMLPPVMISTPIKVLIFVLVDGWRLVTESVVTSFVMQAAG